MSSTDKALQVQVQLASRVKWLMTGGRKKSKGRKINICHGSVYTKVLSVHHINSSFRLCDADEHEPVYSQLFDGEKLT